MRNYKIRMYRDILNMMAFEIVSPWYNKQDHWLFDTLSEAKKAGVDYLYEQEYDMIQQNKTIRPLAKIHNTRMCDLWEEFWGFYDENEKDMASMTSSEYNQIKKRSAEGGE